MKEQSVVGRLAPTPSGRMHLGNVFASLMAWLAAKSQGGQILLRIENLDTQRASLAHAQILMEDLLWLGLVWDDGPTPNSLARYGPDSFFQSTRTGFYEQQLEKLRAKGLVYPCFCSRAQLHTATAPHQNDGTYVYDGRCRRLPADERAALAQKKTCSLRVAVPERELTFSDALCGLYRENLARQTGDFILRRSDGVFAYQLAAAADDGDMGVTQVVRGRDLLSSTPRQIWLIEELGFAAPSYAHIPLLLAPDGRRLAKRDGDTDFSELRKNHKHPQPLIGALAHRAGLISKPEPLSAAELLSIFCFENITHNDVVIKGDIL